MPTRPLGPCSYRGCPQRAVRRGRCEVHAKQADEQYRQAHPDTRPSAAERGYDLKWRRIRAAYLRKHPTCVEPGCNQAATHVDHIKARTQGGGDEWANLQGLCHSHHSSKTNMFDGGFGNRKVTQ